MSIGLRDQRISVYRYSDAGSDGLMDSHYTWHAEYWGRLESPTTAERTVAARAEQRLDAVAVFADEASVGANDLLVVDGVQYLVTGEPMRRRLLSEIACRCVRTDDALGRTES